MNVALALNPPAASAAGANPIIIFERKPMAGHTTMPPRKQTTPYGDVTLTSRWMRDRYHLVATGPISALRWMFPKHDGSMEAVSPHACRHVFSPAPAPITVERELRRVCAVWQARWDERGQDTQDGLAASSPSQSSSIQNLGQLFDHLYADRMTKVAKSTTDRDRYRLLLWRTELGNDRLLANLRPDDIADALARIGKRTSPSTANTSLGVLKTYLTWAANMGLLRDLSHKTVRRLKEPASLRHRREWWTTAQFEQALAIAQQDPHQPTATLLVACGCLLGLRPEEIIMQRWEDLDLDAKDPQTGEPRPVCHVVPHSGWTPKDGEARDIPISARLLAILTPLRRKAGFLLMNEPHRKGRPRGGTGWKYRYNPTKVWRRMMEAFTKAGGKVITMYGMRHTFASNLLINNVSDVKVARWLGHGDTRMLHRHYGHLLSYDDDINATANPKEQG
ncbi:MAG: site-specific integrase [Planctomycetes bacterium]|nr:site-specific integrase [Planctomycetota bacterium]